MMNYSFVWLLASLFSLLDIVLTFYTMFLVQKRGVLAYAGELNVVYRFLVRMFGISPSLLVLVGVWAQGVLAVFFFFFRDSVLVFLGGFVVVVMIHLHNLRVVRAHWNDAEYWVHYCGLG